jgi:hypothetical protein
MSTLPFNSVKVLINVVKNGVVSTKEGENQGEYHESISDLIRDNFKIEEVSSNLADGNNFIMEVLTYNELEEVKPQAEIGCVYPKSGWGNNPALDKMLFDQKQDEKYQPKDLEELAEEAIASDRISVNEDNCYSAKRLKTINFLELMEKHEKTPKEIAKIMDMPLVNAYNLLASLKKGNPTFTQALTRVRLTILAKYFERLGDKIVNKQEACNEMLNLLTEILKDLRPLSLSKGHLKASKLNPIIDKIEAGIKKVK